MYENPEAPNDNNGNNSSAGAIEGTVYSKAWALDALVQLVKALENAEPPTELSDELEETLAKLWDMSTDENVAQFLAENQLVDILLPCCLNCQTEKSSRAAEVALGIMANAVGYQSTGLCQQINEQDYFRQALVGLFAKFSNDVEVLVQLFRLLHASLRSDCQNQWEETILDTELLKDVRDNDEDADEQMVDEFSLVDFFVFVFSNCKNEDVLLDLTKVVEILCGNGARFLLVAAATSKFSQAILEALNELQWQVSNEIVGRMLNCLYMISTVDHFRIDFAKLLATNQRDISSILADFIIKYLENQVVTKVEDVNVTIAVSISLLLWFISELSPSNFPLLYQKQALWSQIGSVRKLLKSHIFTASEEQSPGAILKGNIDDFVQSLSSNSDPNVDQFILSKLQ